MFALLYISEKHQFPATKVVMAISTMSPQNLLSGDSDYEQDDILISKILNGAEEGEPLDFENIGDTVGKLDDAVDYENISDDDLLPDENSLDLPGAARVVGASDGDLLDFMKEDGEEAGGRSDDDLDDLFGDLESMDNKVRLEPEGLDIDLLGGLHDVSPSILAAVGDGIITSSPDSTFSVEMDVRILSPVHPKKFTSQDLVKQYFPDFSPHKVLSFISLFKSKPTSLSIPPFDPPKVCVPKNKLEMAADDKNCFLKNLTEISREDRGIVMIPQESEYMELDAKENIGYMPQEMTFERDLVLACEDWDCKVDAMMITPPTSPKQKRAYETESEDVTHDSRPGKRIKHLNFIDSLPDSWLDDDAILDGDLTSICARVILDLNDPHLLVDIRQPNQLLRTRRIGGEFKRRANKDLTQRYNISNDEAYDLMKRGVSQNQVRGAIGYLEIEHSMPALRHQFPYYKDRLSVKESREYHRRPMVFQINQPLRFFKVEHRKGKTYRKIPVQTVLNTTKDLSLRDDIPFVLLEHSEEYPTVLSNFGMGSRIINYYRRKGPDDSSRPKRDIGETQVLLNQDRSPFWNFGPVDPGETVPTLYNGMIRAPIFQQPAKPTDFLVVRNQNSRESHYFMRNIRHLFVVGQHLPVTGVPGPHSRRTTTAARNRLKMICYRILNRRKDSVMTPKEISPHYPESTELQNRQRVKDVLERVGNGLWKMRPGEDYHNETAIRDMIKPEDLCLLEAMQVGVRNLADAGYAKSLEEDDEYEKDMKSHEQRLSPWVTTKNFIEATQGKAMLQLHGEGDPTGSGEAFSFIKTTMKGGFRAIEESVNANMDKERIKELGGHQYNVARQQREYKEAIARIWKAQKRSLASTEPPELEIENAGREDQVEDTLEEGGLSMIDDDSASQSTRFSATNQGTQVLKIMREARNGWGEMERVEEIITDPKVIRMYIRRRREANAEKTKVEQIVPTGNNQEDEINKQRLRDELTRLQRNKERRELRERQAKRNNFDTSFANPMSPNGMFPDDTPGPKKIVAGKGTTNRKCANCGQSGHIRTNKKICPKLNGSWERLGMSPPLMNQDRQRSGSTPVSS